MSEQTALEQVAILTSRVNELEGQLDIEIDKVAFLQRTTQDLAACCHYLVEAIEKSQMTISTRADDLQEVQDLLHGLLPPENEEPQTATDQA